MRGYLVAMRLSPAILTLKECQIHELDSQLIYFIPGFLIKLHACKLLVELILKNAFQNSNYLHIYYNYSESFNILP